MFNYSLLRLNSGLKFVLFCCLFIACQSKEADENSNVEKTTKDSLKNLLQNIKEKTDSNKKANSNSNENPSEKSTEKTPQKSDSTVIKAKLTKKWQITGNYWVSSIETFNNNENYFLDLRKDGKYTLKAHLEDLAISEEGKWQLQNPKLAFRKFEETDPKDAGVPIEETEEILVLTPKNSTKERLFLFSFEEKEFAFNALTRPSGLFAK